MSDTVRKPRVYTGPFDLVFEKWDETENEIKRTRIGQMATQHMAMIVCAVLNREHAYDGGAYIFMAPPMTARLGVNDATTAATDTAL